MPVNEYPERVALFDDGVYRWCYDMDMWRNRFMLTLILKVIGILSIAMIAIFLALLGPGEMGTVLLILLGIIVLALVVYAVCALVMGGHYHLRFEMDDSAVRLVQSDATRQRNHTLAVIATVAGIAAGKPGEALRVGVTLEAANAVGTTAFSAVRRVRLYPKCDVIDLREWFGMNQIYVNGEDYAFVRDFILSHVPEKAGRNGT